MWLKTTEFQLSQLLSYGFKVKCTKDDCLLPMLLPSWTNDYYNNYFKLKQTHNEIEVCS